MRKSSTRTNVVRFLAEKYEVTEAFVRLVLSRAGLTCRTHSLMCVFSQEEEDALVSVCIAYARRQEAFTVRDFIAIASFFNGKTKESEFFSCSFLRTFRGRHSDIISVQKGKVTSPTRSSEKMLEMIQEFIDKLKVIWCRTPSNE